MPISTASSRRESQACGASPPFTGRPSFYLREPYRTARRIAGRSTIRTIAISEHVRRFVERMRFARPGTARMVHYGIDASGGRARKRNGRRRVSSLGIDDGEVAVGIASRLIAGKGHSMLLDACASAFATRRTYGC